MGSLSYVWACVASGRRDRLLGVALSILGAEGVGLVVGRGDCPLGPLQRRCGDPVPLFELVLPRRAAKAAVPMLAVATIAGVLGLIAYPAPAQTPGLSAAT
jgi:hypothetical protein